MNYRIFIQIKYLIRGATFLIKIHLLFRGHPTIQILMGKRCKIASILASKNNITLALFSKHNHENTDVVTITYFYHKAVCMHLISYWRPNYYDILLSYLYVSKVRIQISKLLWFHYSLISKHQAKNKFNSEVLQLTIFSKLNTKLPFISHGTRKIVIQGHISTGTTVSLQLENEDIMAHVEWNSTLLLSLLTLNIASGTQKFTKMKNEISDKRYTSMEGRLEQQQTYNYHGFRK